MQSTPHYDQPRHDAASGSLVTIRGDLGTADTVLLTGRPDGGTPYDTARLLLTEEGELYLHTRRYVGGDATPAPEWHRRTLAWDVLRGPAELNVTVLRRDLEPGGPLHDLLELVATGHALVWNGNNHVGVLDADASQADEELRARLADDPDRYSTRRTVWDAGDYLAAEQHVPGLTADTTDAELDQVAERLETEARRERVVLQNLRAELERRRQELRETRDE